MTWDEFKARLAALNLLQTEFARIACIDDWGVSRWRKTKKGVPPWVTSWLDLYEMAHPGTIALRENEKTPAGAGVKMTDIIAAHYNNPTPIPVLDSPLLVRPESPPAPRSPIEPDPEHHGDVHPSTAPAAVDREDNQPPHTSLPVVDSDAPRPDTAAAPAPAPSTERAEDQTHQSGRLEFLEERTTTRVSE